jgi:hypothetical protein
MPRALIVTWVLEIGIQVMTTLFCIGGGGDMYMKK